MKKILIFLWVASITTMLFAQDGDTKKIEADAGAWYTAPWVWVVGAAVVILLLITLTRGGSRRSE